MQEYFGKFSWARVNFAGRRAEFLRLLSRLGFLNIGLRVLHGPLDPNVTIATYKKKIALYATQLLTCTLKC
jgi:hypothetical protein